MAIPAATETANAAYQGQPWFVTRITRTAPVTPDAKPAERSISPRSRTKIKPMAMTMTEAA